MTDKEILEVIKSKRENAYNDYIHNIELNKIEEDKTIYQSRKRTINELAIVINTYDDLIVCIENISKGIRQDVL